ncbi:MAG: sulfotransferase [Rhizobiaceae bacterium]
MSVELALRKAKSLARKGDSGEARALYQSVLERFPDNRRALEGMNSLGLPQQARRRRPPLTQDEANALLALYRQGQLEKAIATGRALAARHPDAAFLHNILGACHAGLGQAGEAVACYRRALALDPASAEIRNNLGDALNRLGRHEEAETVLHQALAARPDYPEALNNLANALNHLNRQAEAMPLLQKALRLKPDFAEAFNNLGNAHNDLGRPAEAVAAFEAALKARPGYAEAWRNLAAVRRFAAGDDAIGALENALSAATAPGDRIHLEFALAKALDDIGEHDRAFGHFAAGNRLHRRGIGDPIAEQRNLFGRIRAIFADGVPAPPADLDPSSKRPVFIVGMPRSGTSLVEQILASHTGVHGGGELQVVRRAVAPAVEAGRLDEAAIAAIRKSCIDGLDALGAAEPAVTDKMPLNFRWIGFIAAALPEAVIVHTRRDSVAVAWSIFRTFFPARGLEFSFDLGDIAAYLRLYDELMAFWAERLPGRIVECDYERLTENQEAETRRLLDRCGLGWDERCLAFHETARAVRTASSVQVREKMYRGSSRAWRDYEPHLGPLIEALAR